MICQSTCVIPVFNRADPKCQERQKSRVAVRLRWRMLLILFDLVESEEVPTTNGRTKQKRMRPHSTRVILTQYFYQGIIWGVKFSLSITAMIDTPSFTSFDGHKYLTSGSLPVNVMAVRQSMASGAIGPLLIFCDQTGHVVDIDLRGSDAEILARLAPDTFQVQEGESEQIDTESSIGTRGPGRPKLGVIGREVTLLPRHWNWLAAQPGGASVTLRKLIDEARRANEERDRQRRTIESAYRFMSAMAGDMAGFEEASRALFAADMTKLHRHTDAWPPDIRDYLWRLVLVTNTDLPVPTTSTSA